MLCTNASRIFKVFLSRLLNEDIVWTCLNYLAMSCLDRFHACRGFVDGNRGGRELREGSSFFSRLSNYILRDRHKCLTSWVAVELWPKLFYMSWQARHQSWPFPYRSTVWGISKCRGKYEIYIYWCVLMHLAGSATARQEITGEWAALTGLNCFAKYIQCYSMLSARRNDEQSHPFLWEVLGWGWRCRTSLWMRVRHSFVGWCSPFSAWLCYFSHQAPRQSLRRSGSIHKDLK